MLNLVLIYIIAISILGIIYGGGVKTVKDYVVGSNNKSTFIIIATILGAIIGGPLLVTRSKFAYDINLTYILGFFGNFFCILLYSFLSPYLYKKYKGKISAGEIIEDSYGSNARIITGFCGVILSTMFIAAQMRVFAFLFNYVFGMETLDSLIICLSFVLSYSLFGGARLISINILFKFYILLILIPLIFGNIIQKFGGLIDFFDHSVVRSINFDLSKIDIYKSLSIFLIYSLPCLSQPIISIILMGRDQKQSSFAFLVSSGIFIPLLFIFILIGIVTYAINPNIPSQISFFYALEHINNSYKILLLIGIISIITASIDAYLNGGNVSLIHDIGKSIFPKILDNTELLYMKLSSLFIMLIAFFIAILFNDILSLVAYSQLIWIGIVTIPLLLSIFSNPKKSSFYISMIFSVPLVIALQLFQ